VKKIDHQFWKIPLEAAKVLRSADWRVPESRKEIFVLAMGGSKEGRFEVAYEWPGKEKTVEAVVTQCNNGVAINYPDDYMRRRDPDSMTIADNSPTDKGTFRQRFGYEFEELREKTFDWLARQELLVVPFTPGQKAANQQGLLIAPRNATFFSAALADIQKIIPPDEVPRDFCPKILIYLAPPFRHHYFKGQQIVVHDRCGEIHQIFSYNLYPGPSAKKGVYSALLDIGEREGWLTLHASTVQVVTPYDNTLTILHEGASGGGKSEMLEYLQREHDGRVCLGKNTVTGESRMLTLGHGCSLRPVTDDMALCHSSLKKEDGKLVVTDAENAWFVRVNHILQYGTDPHLEKLCVHPPEPLIFLNLKGAPGGTCLLWEDRKSVV
jgi:hypothetical protein